MVGEGSSWSSPDLGGVVGGGMWVVVNCRGGWWATMFVIWRHGTGDSSEKS